VWVDGEQMVTHHAHGAQGFVDVMVSCLFHLSGASSKLVAGLLSAHFRIAFMR